MSRYQGLYRGLLFTIVEIDRTVKIPTNPCYSYARVGAGSPLRIGHRTRGQIGYQPHQQRVAPPEGRRGVGVVAGQALLFPEAKAFVEPASFLALRVDM